MILTSVSVPPGQTMIPPSTVWSAILPFSPPPRHHYSLFQNKELLPVSCLDAGYHGNDGALHSSEILLDVLPVMLFFLRPRFICQTRFFFLSPPRNNDGSRSREPPRLNPACGSCSSVVGGGGGDMVKMPPDTNRHKQALTTSAARAYLALINMAAGVNPLVSF